MLRLLLLVTFIIVVYGKSKSELFDKLPVRDKSITRFSDLPEPGDLVFQLTEDEYEDYLDFWFHEQYENQNIREIRATSLNSGCSFSVNSLVEPQPVFFTGGKLMTTVGNTGIFEFNESETIFAACPGKDNGLTHPSNIQGPVDAIFHCHSKTEFSSPTWLSKRQKINTIKCRSHPPSVEYRNGTCAFGKGSTINIGVQSSTNPYIILNSCFYEKGSEVFYVEYDQTPENKIFQTKIRRPLFSQGKWFPGLNVNTLYTQVSQKAAIASLVGQDLADKYVNSSCFLTRGHLAAKTDFVLSQLQRATFTFLNTAPQWLSFNGGNWNYLEQSLRIHIGNKGYRTRIYTGTWGIMELRDSSGIHRPIYLDPVAKKIPVPLWFYKVAYEPSTRRGIAFLGMNNPHVTLKEARNMTFCTNVCIGSTDFSWLTWKIDNIALGYVLCCDVNDFRRTVNHLPTFHVNGLLI